MGRMGKSILTVCLVLAAAAGALCAGSALLRDDGPAVSGPPPTLGGGDSWNGTVLFLGDSITDLCDLSVYYPGLNAVNQGISGETTGDILKRMDESVYACKPDILVVLAGVNDILSDMPDSEVTDNLRAIIEGVRRTLPGTEIILQSIYPVSEGEDLYYTGRIRAVNERLMELASELRCRYVDVFSALCTEDGRLDGRYSDDGLHLNDAGYEKACPLVADSIAEMTGR